MISGTQNVRTVALMFIVLIYLMFGAAVFNACKCHLSMMREREIQHKISVLLLFSVEAKEEAKMRILLRQRIARILYKNETIPNEYIFNNLVTAIFEHRHVRPGTAKQWTFPGAFYFSTLVITLIGEF